MSDSTIQDLTEAQASLEVTVREYITQLTYQLRDPDATAGTRDAINRQLAKITPVYYRLLGRDIAIIAAKSKDDIAAIKSVSNDVQEFIKKIKRVEKMVNIATSLVKFVVVCLGDTKDPISIFNAGKDVYTAMNDKIAEEAPKGDSAATAITQPMAIPMAVQNGLTI
jgi:hypothetical protein